MPILKQLVSNSSQSKRRSRADLTVEMISAPLGDFRHTMHVGRGGDAFGDTSFLSTRSGEPPREGDSPAHSPSPKPGLFSRTFRHSRRSQSVTRADKRESTLAPPRGSPTFVKNAVSLPHLNDEDGERRAGRVPKSLSSSPLKKAPDSEKPANGAAAAAAAPPSGINRPYDPELDEKNFGELTDLPPSSPPRVGGGLKHAESVMSFHIDLGPSMLGDILSVMDKSAWEEDDLGFEEGRSSEGRGSPPLLGQGEVESRPPRASDSQAHRAGPLTPEPQPRRQHPDTSSVSSAGSAALEGSPAQGDAESVQSGSPQGEDEKDFSFMDEDDDEIRV